ncbi:hypothetical protein ACOMHN_058080 [Nucella lapillus]
MASCSEDVPKELPSHSQTNQEASVADVQPDAEKVDQPRAALPSEKPAPAVPQAKYPSPPAVKHNPPRPVNRTRDTIVIKGKSGGSIKAEGLAAVLQPGGAFVLGNENYSVIHQDSALPKGKKKIRNRYKVTESCAEPVIRHLDVVSAGLTGDWYDLGKHLGLADATLRQIEMDYKREGQHEINYRALAKWKQEKGRVTLHMLAKALVEVGRGDLADELRKG